MSILVEPCGPERWALAMALLPELLDADRVPAQAWVARLADHPLHLVGAGAVVTRPRDQRRTGYRAQVQVLPAWRRQGVGSRLLQRLCDDTRHWGVPYLHGWTDYAGGVEVQFLRRHGFEPLREISHFHGDTATTLPQLRQRVQRVLAHQPADQRWQLQRLDSADTPAVAALYAAHFGVSPQAAERRIAQALATPIGQACSVLGRNAAGELCGFLLARPKDGLPEVDLWLVDPRHRLGPGALLLLTRFVECIDAIGAPGAHFHCHDDTPATLKVARRIGARRTHEAWTYAKPLSPQAGAA